MKITLFRTQKHPFALNSSSVLPLPNLSTFEKISILGTLRLNIFGTSAV
jgi:hypothetical protein